MTDQLEPAVRTLIDAANAGNIEAFLSGFTDGPSTFSFEVDGDRVDRMRSAPSRVATVHPGNRPTG